jgi:hypothetical protein
VEYKGRFAPLGAKEDENRLFCLRYGIPQKQKPNKKSCPAFHFKPLLKN